MRPDVALVLKEVTAAQARLELDMLVLLRNFQQDYGLTVTSLDVNVVDTFDGQHTIAGVRAEVKLR